MRNISNVVKKNQNTNFRFNSFFFFLNRAVYEVMWKNMVEPDRSHMHIWRMRIAHFLAKATNTGSKYVILLYVFFWVFPRRPIVVCRRFGILYKFHLQGLDVKYVV